jgi:short-subunit dehydrogenase
MTPQQLAHEQHRDRTGRPYAIVTGASSGIGFELARQFVDHDFDVVVVAEDDAVADVPDRLGAGAAATPMQADLRKSKEVERLWSAISATGRRIDALVLNAGVGNAGPFIETSLESDLELIKLNVTSVVHLAKLALPAMVERGEGRVLFTSSVAATMPGPWYATYAASKAFVLSFAEALRHELKDTGVTVTALMPGPTDTNFFVRAGMEGTRVDRGPKDDPAEVARDGFEALMAGKDHVVAGSAKNALQSVMARVLPKRVSAAVHARFLEHN